MGAKDRKQWFERELGSLAELCLHAAGAIACFIDYSTLFAHGRARAASTPLNMERLEPAILSRLERKRSGIRNSKSEDIILNPGESLEVLGHAMRAPHQSGISGTFAVAGSARAAAILVVPAGTTRGCGISLTQLAAECALRIIALQELEMSRDFWRSRAATSIGRADGGRFASRKSLDDSGRQAMLDRLVARIGRAGKRNFLHTAGRMVAALGLFAGWAIALSDSERGMLEMRAEENIAIGALTDGSAVVEAWRRRHFIIRTASETKARLYPEDRMLNGGAHASYISIPFEVGAILLISNDRVDAAALASVKLAVERLDPYFKIFVLEEAARRRDALIHRLGLRLLGAIDGERRRIAQELHDDNAQMLTVARLGLAARRDQAEKILNGLEQRLRQRVGTLRTAPLKKGDLLAALEAEEHRLRSAGIGVKLTVFSGARGLPRPLQDVCYHVVREASSNILNHSRARHVTIRLRRETRQCRIEIVNDGVCETNRGKRSGFGLAGLAERLEFLGGALDMKIERRAAKLIAQIPVAWL